MKINNFDVILFFKVGKFYELFHTDALIAVKELGIILMKGDHAHCGFPERGFAKYSSQLIEKRLQSCSSKTDRNTRDDGRTLQVNVSSYQV
jgi:DNA mismatch repair ATPase MutS